MTNINLKCIWIIIYATIIQSCDKIYDYPTCDPHCLADPIGCPQDVACHQVSDRVYRVNAQCYKAVGNCSGCLLHPTNHSGDLQAILCNPCPEYVPNVAWGCSQSANVYWVFGGGIVNKSESVTAPVTPDICRTVCSNPTNDAICDSWLINPAWNDTCLLYTFTNGPYYYNCSKSLSRVEGGGYFYGEIKTCKVNGSTWTINATKEIIRKETNAITYTYNSENCILPPTNSPTTSPTLNPTHYPTASPTKATLNPTHYPSYRVINNTNSTALFVIPNVNMTFSAAQSYCQTRYPGGSLANIYDPKENDKILQLVDLHSISYAFIGYHRNPQEFEWEWDYGIKSNPMLWLTSPLAQVSTNIEDPTKTCMTISRFGWIHTNCEQVYYFVCETRNHTAKFITSDDGVFVLSERKLSFEYARSLCRAQFKDLATIYEAQEYAVAQTLCAKYTANISHVNEDYKTNCWIGYQRGVLNVNEWEWVQNIPTSVIPINNNINPELWSINPWQISDAKIYCQPFFDLSLKYAFNGYEYEANTTGVFTAGNATEYTAKNVLYTSNILFKVSAPAKSLPGLICSIHFEDQRYSTLQQDYRFWSITASDRSNAEKILKANVDQFQTPPKTIDKNAEWIWNYQYINKSYVTKHDSCTFKFSFKHVTNVQNKPGDNCASISYFKPNKWKTNNCAEEFYFICNTRNHIPNFQKSDNGKFALLTDRQLTQDESKSLCQNLYGDGLATIYTHYEFSQINDMLINNSLANVWIGLTYDNKSQFDNIYKTDTSILSDIKTTDYIWETQTENFLFDSWTLNIWKEHPFLDDPKDKKCVLQTDGSKWQNENCDQLAYSSCNIESHTPKFKSSQLGSFYLLENQYQNYMDGEELCRDYVGLRSTGAIIYHPLENERAIWLCSNITTNNKGCFIGYSNLKPFLDVPTADNNNNNNGFQWRNGALINEFHYPWFYNPWLKISNITNTTNIDHLIKNKFGDNSTGISYCAAIMKQNDENNNDEWGWDIVDCERELNMICDSENDHAECWMLQSCAQCALRSDCGWCGNNNGMDGHCQLANEGSKIDSEICYESELIYHEFGCWDHAPIVNMIYKKNYEYVYNIDIDMCGQTAPENIPPDQLAPTYVNLSNCVHQNEIIQLYFTSDHEHARYGNYEIFGKVLNLTQWTDRGSPSFHNYTTFKNQPACDINVKHGYVDKITCDGNGEGYRKNLTQFDMLHDMLRYLLPRLQTRLFKGWDIPQESLFGYSTMQRTYDGSVDHTIHRKFSKQTLVNERYANSTTDLLWIHQSVIDSEQTNIKHMNFSLIHVFTKIPHHDETEKRQLFTWVGYKLSLISNHSFAPETIKNLSKDLYDNGNVVLKTTNYTFAEWRGIKPGNFMYNFRTKGDENNNEHRRMASIAGAIEEIRKLCLKYDNITRFGFGGRNKVEPQIGIWGFELWVSQFVQAIKEGGSFDEIMKRVMLDAASGLTGGTVTAANKPNALELIPKFLYLDLGFIFSIGFGWKYETNDKVSEVVKEDWMNCPLTMIAFNAVQSSKAPMNKEAEEILLECCKEFVDDQQLCGVRLRKAHVNANNCLRKNKFCDSMGLLAKAVPVSPLTGVGIYQFDWNYAPPSLFPIFKFIISILKNPEQYKKFEMNVADLFAKAVPINAQCLGQGGFAMKAIGAALEIADGALAEQGELKDNKIYQTIVSFAQTLNGLIMKGRYLEHKSKMCKIQRDGFFKNLLQIKFDIQFNLGFAKPSLRDLCGKFEEFTATPTRRRMQDVMASYPIVPDIPLPCIPIAPPELMLCPQISVATDFGIDFEPEVDIPDIGLGITPSVSFDITASLSLTLGIAIINAQVVMGVKISLIAMSFPFDVGLNIENFGLFSSLNFDITVLSLEIFLKFRICFDLLFFTTCPIDVTLWHTTITAWSHQDKLFQYGMGSKSHLASANMPPNTNAAQSILRFYLAFKDSATDNHEYNIGLEKSQLKAFEKFSTWSTQIFRTSGCTINEAQSSVKIEWYDDITLAPDNMTNITDPYKCKYGFDGFDKLFVAEVTIQWYSTLGMNSCFKTRVKPMFEEKLCCSFALTMYKALKKTIPELKLPGYEMIVMDTKENWSDKCARFYLNTEVQINEFPWYDDCSDEGWKIANKNTPKSYTFGYHPVYGGNTVVHYNGKGTCLNLYNTTKAIKTKRTFEIMIPYDFLVVAARFWAKPGTKHNASDWYGIKIFNTTNYYWLNNINESVCVPSQSAYSNWYDITQPLTLTDGDGNALVDETSYCYTDVLMYFDPLLNAENKYRFDLEVIANVPEDENFGFSDLVMNVFQNEDICVNGINPVTEVTTNWQSSSNLHYTYLGLKDVPSLYDGYLLFEISFDYRFADISALISLSTDDSNDASKSHWVINFDNKQSGIWIRCGTGSIPSDSDGVLSLNTALSKTIVDRAIVYEADQETMIERVFTKMYMQWNGDKNKNFMRIGFGHILGLDVIASVDYNKFKFDTSNIIKYVGFARSLGNPIPDVQWKIYKNNLPSFCLSQTEKEKIHQTQNYKQTCIEDETGNAKLIIYDLVTPDCIYYTPAATTDSLSYTFMITEPHDYVEMSIELFAQFTSIPRSNGTCTTDGILTVYYAADGDHYILLPGGTSPSVSFHMKDSNGIDNFSHLSKLRFKITGHYLKCSIKINGKDYTTSDLHPWKVLQPRQTDQQKQIIQTPMFCPTCIWNNANSTNCTLEFSFKDIYGSEFIGIHIGKQYNDTNDTNIQIHPKWDPNLNRQVCKNKDYYDGISNHFATTCHGLLNATFAHLSQETPFSVSFTPINDATQYGIGNIRLDYGLCYDVLPLISMDFRYDANFYYFSSDELRSISKNYIFGMALSELDKYESSESYISVGTKNSNDPRFIVRFIANSVEILTSVNGQIPSSKTSKHVNGTTNSTINKLPLINNKNWFEFYIEWDKEEGYFRVGRGYILGANTLAQIDFYELYTDQGVIIDSIGVRHHSEKIDWNVVTFQFVPTNEPKLCWTKALELVARKSWVNADMKTKWLNGEDKPTVRVPSALTTNLIFNGPFTSGKVLSRSLTSVYRHDYIRLQTTVYGFGTGWDVKYPIWLNGLSVFFNETHKNSLIWYGTFLPDGGVTNKRCDISEYKQWFSWEAPTTLNGLPIHILTDDVCYYDIDIYIKHKSMNEPFAVSFVGDLEQTNCHAAPQFNTKLESNVSVATTIHGYPKMLNNSLQENSYQYCYGLCNELQECRAWIFNVTGYCWLKNTSHLSIVRSSGFISGICNNEYIDTENEKCVSDETSIQYGYKPDSLAGLQKNILTNSTNAIIDCKADNMLTITISNDTGITFGSPTVSQKSDANLTIYGLTYASRLKFEVTNNGYILDNNVDTIYGIEAANISRFFIHECGENIFLGNFSHTQNRTISSYQWKITAGLSMAPNTVSFEANGNYITFYESNPPTNIEPLRLTLPSPQNGAELTNEVRIVCLADNTLNISFAANGSDFQQIGYYALDIGKYLEINRTDITNISKLKFSVLNFNVSGGNLAGLKCSIYTSLAVISTSNDSTYWEILNASKGDTKIEEVTSTGWNTYSAPIASTASWIWNYDCTTNPTPALCEATTVVFQFSFEKVPLYSSTMSTFKLTPCTIIGQENSFVINGIDKYENYSFALNNKLLPNKSDDCAVKYNYGFPESDVILTLTENTTPICWTFRSASPGGLGCKITVDGHTYVTNKDNSNIWLSPYSNNAIVAVNDAYWNKKLNLTKLGGSWIWPEDCSPVSNTNCIENYYGTFVFSLETILPYEKMTNCQEKCETSVGCDGWVYRNPDTTILEPICYLSDSVPLDLKHDSNYITGFHIETNKICGYCNPEAKYYYIYIEKPVDFVNPLSGTNALYSYGCDYKLSSDQYGNLTITNLNTLNTLSTITKTDLAKINVTTWRFPVRYILHGPILIITDNVLQNTLVYQQHCSIETTDTYSPLTSTDLGVFYIPDAFSVQFSMRLSANVTTAMQIMTLSYHNNSDEYFSFGWDMNGKVYVKFNGVTHSVSGEISLLPPLNANTDFTIKIDPKKLQIWVHGVKSGYQVIKFKNPSNKTTSQAKLSHAYTIAPWNIPNPMPNGISISSICISDLPFEQYQSNRNEFDENMRCWSDKYKNIDRRNEFISTFISDAGCASVTSSCLTSFGED
eukprot:352327_1